METTKMKKMTKAQAKVIGSIADTLARNGVSTFKATRHGIDVLKDGRWTPASTWGRGEQVAFHAAYAAGHVVGVGATATDHACVLPEEQVAAAAVALFLGAVVYFADLAATSARYAPKTALALAAARADAPSDDPALSASTLDELERVPPADDLVRYVETSPSGPYVEASLLDALVEDLCAEGLATSMALVLARRLLARGWTRR